MGLTIELLGAPGSGKTTMVPAVAEACRRQGLTGYTVEEAARCFAGRTLLGQIPPRRLSPVWRSRALWATYRTLGAWHTLRFALSHPSLTRYVLLTQHRRPSEADARPRRVRYWYLRTMGTIGFLSRHARPDEVILLEEGLIHRAVQLHASSVEKPAAETVARYLSLLPRPDLIVHVDASAATCRRRVAARGVWDRLAHRSPDEIDRLIDSAHSVVGFARREIGRLGWPVVDADNDGVDIPTVRGRLVEAVAVALGDAATAGVR